jgi:glycosidase
LENKFPPVEQFGDYFDNARVKNRPKLRTTKPGRAAVAALKQMTVFQATYVGAPMIYYGTEVGLWGANDPCDRQTMLWDDIAYDAETHAVSKSCRNRPRQPDHALFAFFKKSFALRRDHAALRRGKLKWINSRNPRVAAFERSFGHEKIVVVLNASGKDFEYRLRREGRDLWNDGVAVSGGVKIKPGGWLVAEV